LPLMLDPELKMMVPLVSAKPRCCRRWWDLP
jgi:hypothetical protein